MTRKPRPPRWGFRDVGKCHVKNAITPSSFGKVGFVIEELSVDDDIWEFLGYVEYDED